METSESFTFTFESRIDNIPQISSTIKTLCSASSLSEIDLYKLELCLVEALNNVIIHSYHNQPGNKIEVVVNINADHIGFTIFDTGSGPPSSDFLKKALQAKIDQLGNLASVPENGRGLFIMQEFMDEIAYEAKDGKNILSLRKNLNLDAAHIHEHA